MNVYNWQSAYHSCPVPNKPWQDENSINMLCQNFVDDRANQIKLRWEENPEQSMPGISRPNLHHGSDTYRMYCVKRRVTLVCFVLP